METSAAEVVDRHKYHIAGAAVGVVLAAAVLALLWKTQALSKLRFFNKKMEEAQRESVQN